MERTVVCRQRMASGDVRDIVEQPQLVCPHPKISSMKSCHLQACSGENKAWSTKPPMEDTDGKPAPVTLNVSRGKAKANKLKVGGSAVLHEGTALRLKCPVFVLPGHPRPLVKWLKDGRPLTFSKRQKAHFKESTLGAVKIKSLRKADAGTYTCIAGRIRETIDLTVISRLSVTKPLNFLANDQHTSSRPLFIGSNSNTIQRFYANSTDALRILQTVSQKTTQTPFTSNALVEEDVRVTKDHGKPVEDFEDRTSPAQSQYTVKPTEIVNNEKSQVDLDIAVSMALNAFQRSENDQKEFLHGKADISHDGKRILLRSRSGGSRLAIEWKIAEWSSCSKSCGGDGSQVSFCWTIMSLN
jgi:Immunoglobulin domain